MAPPKSNVSRPWRPLGFLLVVFLALGATMFAQHLYTPKLALDLSGGTTVRLTAVTPGGKTPSDDSMQQAISIIRQRVNGLGVSEAEVTQQGESTIVVAVPGQGQREVVKQVGRTAQLRFRQVLLTVPVTPKQQRPPQKPAPSGSPSASPQASASEPASSAEPSSSASPQASGSSAPESKNRALSAGLTKAAAQPQPPRPQPPQPGQGRPGQVPIKPGQMPGQMPGQAQQPMIPNLKGIKPETIKKFQQLDCSKPTKTRQLRPQNEQVVACGQDGKAKYILGPTKVAGKRVSDAQASLPQQGGGGGWFVQLDFDSKGAKQFGTLTRKVVKEQQPRNQVAIALDGLVVSAPVINEPIPGGKAQITGNFSQEQASDLANVLKYGALPLKFKKSSITSVSPTLGQDQLNAGLIAAAIGMALVFLYSLLYYRALGSLIITSLAISGAMAYASVVLLGEYIGYRLSLAGVAGLIVSIGITADSFIVYFERLRDEIREGRSLRVAVERGWQRARRTIITSDMVSFLAAVVLWLLAVGGVRGFAFTLGLTTFVDLIVVFLFTKPLLTVLARTKFFGGGHPLSGLDPKHLGARKRHATTVGARRGRAAKEA